MSLVCLSDGEKKGEKEIHREEAKTPNTNTKEEIMKTNTEVESPKKGPEVMIPKADTEVEISKTNIEVEITKKDPEAEIPKSITAAEGPKAEEGPKPDVELAVIECIPPVRPERQKRQSVKIPEWTPPRDTFFSYLFGCFKPRHSD